MFRGHLSRFFQETLMLLKEMLQRWHQILKKKKNLDTLDNIVGQMFEFHT